MTGKTDMGWGSRPGSQGDTAQVAGKTRLAAGLSLGVFMLALESERLSALVHVSAGAGSVMPLPTSLITLLVFAALTVLVCLRPPRRPAPDAACALVSLACSLGVCSMYFLQDAPALWPLQMLGDLFFSLSPPLLVYFWLQRCVAFGRRFVMEGFGIGGLTLGFLGILTTVLDRPVALVLVAALPLVGFALLRAVREPGAGWEAGGEAGHADGSDGRWSALAAVARPAHASGAARAQAGRPGKGQMCGRALVKLVPFFCYALVFGSVHFSWVALQDEESVGLWVQLGASVGAMACGAAALALARLHWGRALESIMHLLLAAFAIVALWLSTFLTSGYVFMYLVLLNVAQKLTFMLMLVFGFPLAQGAGRRTSLWAVAYLSFFAGTFVSSLTASTCSLAGLNVVAALAVCVLLAADVAGVASLYGGERDERPAGEGAGARAGESGARACEDAGARAGEGVRADGSGRAEAGEPGAPRGREDEGPHAGGAGAALGGAREPRDACAAGFRAEPAGTAEPGRRDGAPETGGPGRQASVAEPERRGAGFESVPYTCHLIACEYDLTRREEEVLQLLVRGRTAARIAETLCITTATTRTHLRNIYAKLGVHSQQDILDLFEDFASRQG